MVSCYVDQICSCSWGGQSDFFICINIGTVFDKFSILGNAIAVGIVKYSQIIVVV